MKVFKLVNLLINMRRIVESINIYTGNWLSFSLCIKLIHYRLDFSWHGWRGTNVKFIFGCIFQLHFNVYLLAQPERAQAIISVFKLVFTWQLRINRTHRRLLWYNNNSKSVICTHTFNLSVEAFSLRLKRVRECTK